MKKIILLLIFLFIFTKYVFCQTNTFPTGGNVGIGTTSPTAKLQVNGGNIFIGNPAIIDSYDQLYSAGSNPGFRQEVQRSSGGAAFDLNNVYAHKTSAVADALWAKIGIYGDFGTSGVAALPAAIYMYFGTEPTVSYYNNTFRLYPNKNAYFDGKVGIGTATPLDKLNVQNGNLSISNSIWALNSLMGAVKFFYSPTPNAYAGIAGKTNGGGADQLDLLFYTAYGTAIEQMRIMSLTGNVLIGKTSQVNNTYKLDVNGNARMNKVVVNTTGADFVFDPAYQPLPLDSLRAFIQKNHHLPDIPSADEMQKEGLDVGDNQIKLLQKIEELTLIVIEQNKRIEKLEFSLQNSKDPN